MRKRIWCIECKDHVEASLVNGYMVYKRKDLKEKKFYQCKNCRNAVGVHPGTIKPLGVIANKEVKQARTKIHALIDPLWKKDRVSRAKIYKALSEKLGYEYHTGHIRSIEEAREVWVEAAKIHNSLL